MWKDECAEDSRRKEPGGCGRATSPAAATCAGLGERLSRGGTASARASRVPEENASKRSHETGQEGDSGQLITQMGNPKENVK